MTFKVKHVMLVCILFIALLPDAGLTDPLNCDMSQFQPQDGLAAMIENETLILQWQGDPGNTLVLKLAIDEKTPVIRELSIQPAQGDRRSIIRNAVPEVRVVSGLRRVTQQQTEPLEDLGVPLTVEKLNEIKWDAFWDAPLYISDELPFSHTSSIPDSEAFANHPGMPRKPDEIVRATAQYNVTHCEVKTNGARIEVLFPGVTAGIFTGYLQFDVFKGSNLIRQTLVAKTDHPSAAFKYDAGLRGMLIQDTSRVVWRDLAQHPQEYKLGGVDARLNDIETMKSIGVDIFSIIDGARGPGRKDTGDLYLKDLADYAHAATRLSDKDFLVMPNDENSTGGRRPFLGGHYDILFSKPVFWRPQRLPGQPLVQQHPTYGTIYNLGTPSDMMKMTEKENALISMPHPNTKRSTGYPEAIKDEPHFLHENYFSLGYRWGMGIDASEKRLGEYRFQSLWDKTNNWMAQKNRPPKYALAISEIRSDYGRRGRPPYDDAYGMSPINYVKLDRVPDASDMSSVIDALKNGDFFVTSGEVLIPEYKVKGEGARRTLIADVEWTFPLEFVEVVWGDGEKTDRKVISTTSLPPFGKKRFSIPFDATGKKWVRFAAWDIATNGAMVQPVPLD